MGTYARSRVRLFVAAVIALAALGTHTTAAADGDERPVPVDRLVPGVPFGPAASRQVDTPDQGAPPLRIGVSTAEPLRSAAPSEDEAEDDDWVDPQLVEFVPAEDAERAKRFQEERAAEEENEGSYGGGRDGEYGRDGGDGQNGREGEYGGDGRDGEYAERREDEEDGGASNSREYCTSFTGPFQREVEKRLRLRVNGEQSPADCAEIRSYQKSKGIVPASGFAGPTTWGHLRLDEATRKGPNASRRCPAPAKGKRIVCIDLNRQLLWVQTSSTKVVFGPVAIRSGRKGYLTRTGRFTVYWRHKNHVSDIYDAPMPYSQFFSGGQAMHATPGSVYKAPGSHGCINLSNRNARLLWNLLKLNEAVYVWGAKPAV